MQPLGDLAKKLGHCGKCLREGNRKEAAGAWTLSDKLGQMARDADELQEMDRALAELDRAREQMTCPYCQGAGSERRGGGGIRSRGPGTGSAGPAPRKGRGAAPRPATSPPCTTSHVKQQYGPGTSAITGWAGGPNIKGDVQVEIKQRPRPRARARLIRSPSNACPASIRTTPGSTSSTSEGRVDVREKGDSPHLCEAPFGPFRQMGTVPFFP